jgi:hypothetical protein
MAIQPQLRELVARVVETAQAASVIVGLTTLDLIFLFYRSGAV